MNHTPTLHYSPPFMIIFMITLGVAASYCLFFLYTGLQRAKAAAGCAATLLGALGVATYHARVAEKGVPYPIPGDIPEAAVWVAVLFILSSAFCIRLYRKWLDGQLTERERVPGTAGIRAWLSPANLLVAAGITVSAWLGLGWSPVLMLALTLGALVAWPAMHEEESLVPNPAPENASREREKVLSLLEAGKITANESAELLHALGASAPAAAEPPRAPMTAARRLVLCGAGLVLVGFLLPWFSFAPGLETASFLPPVRVPTFHESDVVQLTNMGVIHIRGGNVPNGLGWTVLVLGFASALLPYLAPSLDRSPQRTLRWLALGAGGIVLLYLLSQDLRLVSAGLVITLVGYACEAIGTWREEHRSVVRAAAPVEAGA